MNGAPGKSAFAPQVHVAADGTVAVTYYDLRSDTAAPESLLADHWMARSRDGELWAETHLAGPFDLRTAPFAGGYFLGDYMGLASAAGEFLSLYVRTTGDSADPTDVYLARVATLAPGVMYRGDEAKDAAARGLDQRRVSRALKAAIARRLAGR